VARKLVYNHSHWGAFQAEVEDGRIVGVVPFERDPDPSPLLGNIPASVHSSSRIPQPMVREGWLAHGPDSGKGRGSERFVPVSWEKVLDLVAGELTRVKSAYGNAAIMGGSQGWASAGIFHGARGQVRRFLAAFGGFVDQTSNYSFGTAMTFLPHVLGTAQAVSGPLTSWSSIARHAKLVVLFGGANPKNTQVALGGAAAHAIKGWMQELARAGVAMVNVSPIRADGPEAAAPEWIPIRPNTDTALLLALTHTLVTEGLHDTTFLATHCVGFERVLPYLMGEPDGQAKNAEWAAAITEVPADAIRTLARRMTSTRTMLSCSWSLQRADHGEQPYWALILLASALGQIGSPGGGFGFGYGSSTGIADPPIAFAMPAMEGLANPTKLAIPAARIADCLLNSNGAYDYNGRKHTYPDIKLVYWAGGNPFHHHQDLNRLRRAWQKPETIIVHEPWWTATARFADIVLPATTSLERNDIGAGSRDCYVIAMHKAIEPVGLARDDFAIFAELARRLDCAAAFAEGRDEMRWLRHLYDRFRTGARTNENVPDFDDFWAKGWLEIPRRNAEYVMFDQFRADPTAHRLGTPSGKIELYSERIASFGYPDCPPHPTWLEPAEWLGADATTAYPLHLVSNQPRFRLHSQMDLGPVSAQGKIGGREAIAINPVDAKQRDIKDGDVVRVFNTRGACLAGAVITPQVRPGVVQLSCGAWYDPADQSPDVVCAHGNPNVLTYDRGTSRLGQGPSSATALVEIERVRGAVPPVRAFVPPALAENEA
jgi:biotin/methionine sulfoxide reductase